MKKLMLLPSLLFVFSFCTSANAQDVLVGTYANDAGTVTIAKAAKGEHANYDVTIADKSGQCKVSIVAATNKVTAKGQNGATFHPNTIAAVESETFPNFSLWPEDQTIRLADDALPFAKLDNACQTFKGNMVFTRQK